MDERLAYLKERISDEVYQRLTPLDELYQDGSRWIFDFRRVFLDAAFISSCAEVFWDIYGDRFPFQVGGIESASIPLITAIVLEGKKRGKVISAFYMRKSRKKKGLGRVIEGTLTDEPIILVDDLINFGNSFLKLKETLELEKKNVTDAFALVRFRELDAYAKTLGPDIVLSTPFTLTDFGIDLLTDAPARTKLVHHWYFKSEKPSFFYHSEKAKPVILDEHTLLIGSDNGVLWFLDTEHGSVARKLSLGFPWGKNRIIHTPLFLNGNLYAGMANGNVFCVDAGRGKIRWAFFEAESSRTPVFAYGDAVYIVSENKTLGKQGTLYGLSLLSGEKLNEIHFAARPLPHVHLWNGMRAVIVTGDGEIHIIDLQKGRVEKTIALGETLTGSFAVEERTGTVIVTSASGSVYTADLKRGTFEKKDLSIPSWTRPLITEDTIYISSLDKHIYALDRKNWTVNWKFQTRGRIFASPVLRNGKLYVGSNDGCLYVLRTETGKPVAYFQATERIINEVVFDSTSDVVFVSTQGNEIYAIRELA